MLPVKLSINTHPSVFGLQQSRNRRGHATAVSPSPTFTTVRLGEHYVDYGAHGSTLRWIWCAWEHIHWLRCAWEHITVTTVHLGAHYSEYGVLGSTLHWLRCAYRSTLHWLRCAWEHIMSTTVRLGAYYSDYGALESTLQWLRCAWKHITLPTVCLGASLTKPECIRVVLVMHSAALW